MAPKNLDCMLRLIELYIERGHSQRALELYNRIKRYEWAAQFTFPESLVTKLNHCLPEV